MDNGYPTTILLNELFMLNKANDPDILFNVQNKLPFAIKKRDRKHFTLT